MKKLDLDNIRLKESYSIINEDVFYVEYNNKNPDKNYIVIVDKGLNIIADRTEYIYNIDRIIESNDKINTIKIRKSTRMFIDGTKTFLYMPSFDLFTSSLYIDNPNNVCVYLYTYKVYENKILYYKSRHYNISEYIDKDKDNYFNYSNIIISEFILYYITNLRCVLPKKLINIINSLNSNRDNYFRFYRIIDTHIIEFKIPQPEFRMIRDFAIYNNLSLYSDYTYIIFYRSDIYYLVKIYPDFNEYELINISKLIKEKYNTNINYYTTFILFNELIVEINLHNYKFNLTELFESKEYIDYRIYRIGNTIDKEDLQ